MQLSFTKQTIVHKSLWLSGQYHYCPAWKCSLWVATKISKPIRGGRWCLCDLLWVCEQLSGVETDICLGGREWIDSLSESFIHVWWRTTVTVHVQPQSIAVDYLWLSMGTQLDSINIWSPPQSHQFRWKSFPPLRPIQPYQITFLKWFTISNAGIVTVFHLITSQLEMQLSKLAIVHSFHLGSQIISIIIYRHMLWNFIFRPAQVQVNL